MALLIELPLEVEEKLTVRADGRGVSASDQAAFLLQLVTALMIEGRETPFRGKVESYLRQNGLDADRLADVFEGLMAYCLRDDGLASMPPDSATPASLDPLDRERIVSLLRVPVSPEANSSVDPHVVNSSRGHLPQDGSVRPTARKNRASALGGLAHLNLSTEAFIEEKRLETAREDRPR